MKHSSNHSHKHQPKANEPGYKVVPTFNAKPDLDSIAEALFKTVLDEIAAKKDRDPVWEALETIDHLAHACHSRTK